MEDGGRGMDPNADDRCNWGMQTQTIAVAERGFTMTADGKPSAATTALIGTKYDTSGTSGEWATALR